MMPPKITAIICKSAIVALVMSLFFCISTDQMAIWPALYPKAALIAISCNLLLSKSDVVIQNFSLRKSLEYFRFGGRK